MGAFIYEYHIRSERAHADKDLSVYGRPYIKKDIGSRPNYSTNVLIHKRNKENQQFFKISHVGITGKKNIGKNTQQQGIEDTKKNIWYR
jgi:hypothetical protein